MPADAEAPVAQDAKPQAAAPREAAPQTATAAPEQPAEAVAEPVAEPTPAAATATAQAKPAATAAADAPAPAAPASVNPAAAPAATAPAAAPTAPHRAVPLHRAPAAVATLLSVAHDRGITHAKMALRPAELGGIEIRLQSTAAGVSAQVVADSPEAARMLAQHGDELRRALEARDVTLLSLEVSTTAEQQQKQQSARGEWTDGDDAGSATSSDRSTGDAEGDAEPTSPIHSTIELPGGLLVDVLA